MLPEPQRYSVWMEVPEELFHDAGVDKSQMAIEQFDRCIASQGIRKHSPWELTWMESIPMRIPIDYPWHKEVAFFLARLFGYRPERFIIDRMWGCRGTTLATEIGKDSDGE
jgi:hypothetical protein